MFIFFFQAEDGIRDVAVTGVQTCALPISRYLSGIRVGPGRGSLQLTGYWNEQHLRFLRVLGSAWGRRAGPSLGTIEGDRKSTRLNSSHGYISYAVFCLKKKQTRDTDATNR